MALVTYTATNNNGSVAVQSNINTGVGSIPAARVAVRTPVGGYVVATPANDYGVGSSVGVKREHWEPPSYTCVIDPGLEVNG